MSSNRFSRRSLVPGLATGAMAVSLGAAPAAVPATSRRGRFGAQAGPCWLARGQTLTTHVFLPAVQKVREAAARLSLFSIDGQLLASQDLLLPAGTGTSAELRALADGTLLFNGSSTGFQIPRTTTQIIAILIGLLLPAVQAAGSGSRIAPAATMQVSDTETNRLVYLLPYIEQDNLF